MDELCSHMSIERYSTPQLILYKILLCLYDTKIMYNTRQIIKPYELDIYLPKYKLAFEYDGKIWHETNENDEIKNNKCLKEKILLIRILEYDRQNYIIDIKKQLIKKLEIINFKTNENIIKEDILKIKDNEILDFVNESINDEQNIIKKIKNYDNYHDFYDNEKLLYQKLLRRNLLDKYTSHLSRTRIYWTDEKVKEELSKYEYLSDFYEKSNNCYNYLLQNNKQHMIKLKRKRAIRNLDEIKKEISKYEYLSDFRENSQKHYQYIKNHKLYDLLKVLKRKRL
jgi:hypothetical protein